MLIQEVESSAISQFGIFGMIMRASGPSEGVIPFCIMMDRDKSML
jgi:hypothetical protein